MLDQFHTHEALDRASLICDLIDSHLLRHPFVVAHHIIQAKVEAGLRLIFDAYQDIGSIGVK